MSVGDPSPGYEMPPGVTVFALRERWRVWKQAQFKGSTFCFTGGAGHVFCDDAIQIATPEGSAKEARDFAEKLRALGYEFISIRIDQPQTSEVK